MAKKRCALTAITWTAIPLPNVNSYWTYQPQHLSTTAQATNNTIVFTLTQSYMVEVALPVGA